MPARRPLIWITAFFVVATFSAWASAQSAPTGQNLVLGSSRVDLSQPSRRISFDSGPAKSSRWRHHRPDRLHGHHRNWRHSRKQALEESRRRHWEWMWNHRNWEEKHHREWRRLDDHQMGAIGSGAVN